MHEEGKSAYWVWEDTHTYSEGEKAQVHVCCPVEIRLRLTKLPFSYSSLFISLLHISPSLHPVFLPQTNFFPEMFAHDFPPPCLIFVALPVCLALSSILLLSLSLSPSFSFFVCFQFVATAGLPSLSILKQLPSALWDIRTFVGVCVCYMAKSIWTPLVSGCFSWLGLDRLVSIQGRMLLYSYLIIQWLKYHNSAYTLQSQRNMIMFQHFQECVQHNWDSCFCQ